MTPEELLEAIRNGDPLLRFYRNMAFRHQRDEVPAPELPIQWQDFYHATRHLASLDLSTRSSTDTILLLGSYTYNLYYRMLQLARWIEQEVASEAMGHLRFVDGDSFTGSLESYTNQLHELHTEFWHYRAILETYTGVQELQHHFYRLTDKFRNDPELGC